MANVATRQQKVEAVLRPQFRLTTLLTVLFVGLKLTDNIGWSWLWVLSPIWIPYAVLAVLALGLGILILIVKFEDGRLKRKRARIRGGRS